MKNKAYYNDRKVVKKTRDKGFLGGYKTTYKDKYIVVNVLGERKGYDSYNYEHYTMCLIEMPNGKKKEVNKKEIFTKLNEK